ncbi:acyltransferase family protein [Burkholderia glumae]|uniref:acyltransferase family protein n=1 Tax=Burkholderia glumae TaxID=337 RepID=UPI00215178AB|nr:acyltransferase [Burkholderia glumae]
MSQRRNFGLDVVRMCAILPVMNVHFSMWAFKKAPDLVYIFGDMGVEIFFALSGFLIGGIILRDFERGFSARVALNFYIRRWMRTLPLYWVFFASNMFVTAAGFTLDPSWSVKCLAYLAFLQNLSWPMMADWFQESWSLAVEEWFYLLFPVLFAALAGIKSRNRILMIALILIIGSLGLRIATYNPLTDFDLSVRRVVILRLDAIAFGILAVWMVRTYPEKMRALSKLVGLAGLAGIMLTVAMLLHAVPASSFFLRTFSFSLTSASFSAIVVWAYYQSWDWVAHGAGASIIGWFSTRSYALYLCHGGVVRTMLHKGWFSHPPIVSALVFYPLVFLIAEVVHRIVERPFMHMRPAEIRTTEGAKDHAHATS